MLLERNLPKEHANNAQNKHLQNKPRPRTLTHTDFLKRHILDYQTKKTSVRKHALCCSIVKLLKSHCRHGSISGNYLLLSVSAANLSLKVRYLLSARRVIVFVSQCLLTVTVTQELVEIK